MLCCPGSSGPETDACHSQLVAFPVPQPPGPPGAPATPHPRVPGRLPEAVTEESQASEKSEASPSSTEREQRRAVSSRRHQQVIGVGHGQEESSFVGVPVTPVIGRRVKSTKRTVRVSRMQNNQNTTE